MLEAHFERVEIRGCEVSQNRNPTVWLITAEGLRDGGVDRGGEEAGAVREAISSPTSAALDQEWAEFKATHAATVQRPADPGEVDRDAGAERGAGGGGGEEAGDCEGRQGIALGIGAR